MGSEADIQDEILRLALELQRLSSHEEREADAILRELTDDLERLLNSGALSRRGKEAVQGLIDDVKRAIAARYATVAASLDTHGLVALVAERTVEALKIIAPQIAKVTAETLASLANEVLIQGAPSKDWWAAQSDDLALKFAAQVRQGVINGETNERIVQRIVGKAGEPGIMDVARRNARALVHSSVMTAANDARLAGFRANSRFIRGVRWMSTLDHHSCVVCANLDGQAWDLDGNKLRGMTMDYRSPPAHWNCRCVLTPIPKSEADSGPTIGARASKDGPVAPNTTFAVFLKRQSPEFVERVLGKRRAEMFLAGKLTLRDLVNGAGRPLSLDELKAGGI